MGRTDHWAQMALQRLAIAEQQLADAQQRLDGEAAELAHDEVVAARFTVSSMGVRS